MLSSHSRTVSSAYPDYLEYWVLFGPANTLFKFFSYQIPDNGTFNIEVPMLEMFFLVFLDISIKT